MKRLPITSRLEAGRQRGCGVALAAALMLVGSLAARPAAGAILLGPYVKFTGPDTATVNWLTTGTNVSIVDFGPGSSRSNRVQDLSLATNHSLALTGLAPRTQYGFVIQEPTNGLEIARGPYTFESDYNYAVPSAAGIASPYTNDALSATYAAVAQGVLDGTGLLRGYCLDYGCGDGRLAFELARRSDLNIIGVEEDAASVARARAALKAAGLYGSRISIMQGSLSNLPYPKSSFNLVVSSAMLTATNCPGQSSEVFRVLRPGNGVAWLGYPDGAAGGLSNWTALTNWVSSGIAASNATIEFVSGRSAKITRNALTGGGTWSHGYADAGNTACSQDQRVLGSGMRLQWFGLPGPRGMIDRGCRNPQPLAVNGFLFVEGLNRLCAQDAYNGRIYWAMEVPGMIRVNIPRDASNLCADQDSVYVAVGNRCWRLSAYSGDLAEHYPAAAPAPGTNYDWGYVAVVSNRVYGSSMKRGAAYTEYSGPAYWYDSTGTESTAKVCSDNLFCLARTNGAPLWTYRNGVIINSSIAIGGGRIYFVESRNATAMSQSSGRIANTSLWLDLYLVALDAATGSLTWQQPLTVSTSPYPMVFFLSYSGERLLLTSSTDQFYLYAFNAASGAGLWQKNHSWNRNNHGGHMYHPVIVSNNVYLEPYAYDLATGNVVKSGLPSRAGCSTMSAAGNMMHIVQVNYDDAAICFWDLATDQRRQMVGSRASCWMSIISAGGLVLSPSASAGCTCRYPLQTSIGFAAP